MKLTGNEIRDITKLLEAGKTVHGIGAGTLLVCLVPKIAAAEVEQLAMGMVDWHKRLDPAGETMVVFRETPSPTTWQRPTSPRSSSSTGWKT